MKSTWLRLTLVCIALIVIGLVFTEQSSAKIDQKFIVAVWLLNDGKGDKVKDSSGNGHDGDIQGSTNWIDGKWIKGKSGMALEFLKGGLVTIPHVDSLNLPKWTITALVKVKGITGEWQVIVGKYDMAQAVNFATYATKDTGLFSVQFSSGANWRHVYAKKAITDDQWYYVAATYDTKFMRTYVDGALEGEQVLIDEPNISTAPITMGAWSGGVFPLNGAIDEVGLFNEALSEDDIKSIMAEGIEKTLGIVAVSSIGRLTASWGGIKDAY